MSRRCAKPACRRHLKPRYSHAHCPACRLADNIAAPPKPGTRKALVYTPTTTTQLHFAAVTIPAAPWEVGA